MKKYFLLIITILFSASLFSQRSFSLGDDKKYIDSIVKITINTKSDSIKCLYSFRLSKLFKMIGDSENAYLYLDKGNKLCSKYPFLKDLSTYFNTIKYLENGDIEGYEKAILKTYSDLKKYNHKEASKSKATILQNYGLVLQSKNKENEAMEILINQAIPFALKSENDEITCHIYKAIGVILMNSEERKKANYYLNQAQYYIEKAPKISPTVSETKYETYILNAENLIELKNYSEAKKTIDKAYFMLSKYPNSQFNNTYAFVDGLYYSKLNQHNKAVERFDKGIKICEFYKDSLSLNRLKFAKYESLLELKKYKEAIIIIESLVKNALLDDKKYHYKALSKANNALGNWQKAYSYSEKYIVLNDSLNKTKFKEEIVALEAKFNKIENEKKIGELSIQKEKAELLAKNNRLNTWIFGLISAFLVVLAGFLWKFNQNQKKLSFQKEINFNQEINSLNDQQKLAVSNALLEGEEIERKRLARDLHDGLGSMLSGLKLHLSKLTKDNATDLKNANNQLDNSIKELRQIAQNMMPESLLKLGLNAALQDLCLRFSSSTVLIEFHSLGIQDSISESQQIAIYRIVQELINNAIKHSNASNILVSCTQNGSRFFITVEDNGKGFDVKKQTSVVSMGLKNIKNRVEFLNGKLEIDSEPENGTAFNIELNVA
ncbi:ATP-binding protein [Flavobacterium sp.]|uniref:tetratricopeptide repeat-containing sensor histidine kinase n=1 Tax=Flavobacterium sp. TaxID=239 RepID=UPI00286D672B|nr:ATP-binding protein [Flavobacterium sp.]